jgi:putative endonuclease
MESHVYIMTNDNNTVLYTGVTSDLKERVNQHKSKKHPDSFSARYNICKLVYYETFDTIDKAIKREKQIKGGSRKRKAELIHRINPEWYDLSLLPWKVD